MLQASDGKLALRRQIFEILSEQGVVRGPFLEVGSDIAQTALLLRNEYGLNGFALDLSADALRATPQVAAHHGYRSLPLRICGDARWLPFVDEAFSFIYSFQTLHHFRNIGPVIGEIERVLRKGSYFYFAEEPVRRWLCLYLYRCDRPENLTGLNKWLLDRGLLEFIAEAYPGSRDETSWGIVENQKISLREWDRRLSVFERVRLELSQPPTLRRNRLYQFLLTLGLSEIRSKRCLANLFGVGLSGLCCKAGAVPEQKTAVDIRQLCRCPDCEERLDWAVRPTPHFECPQCGPFPAPHGVHMLFRRSQMKELYPSGPKPPNLHELIPPREISPPEPRAMVEGPAPEHLEAGAKISSVRLLDSAGIETRRVMSGESTTIEVHIEFSIRLDNPAMGFVIRRQIHGEPTVVYDTNTIWQGQTTGRFLAGETVRVRYRQIMALGPGPYAISTAIASHDGTLFYDWRESVIFFEVAGADAMQGIANLGTAIEIEKVR